MVFSCSEMKRELRRHEVSNAGELSAYKSGCRELNSEPHAPKACTLPIELHPASSGTETTFPSQRSFLRCVAKDSRSTHTFATDYYTVKLPYSKLRFLTRYIDDTVPRVGIEPTRPILRTQDFKSCLSTGSNTSAILEQNLTVFLQRFSLIRVAKGSHSIHTFATNFHFQRKPFSNMRYKSLFQVL